MPEEPDRDAARADERRLATLLRAVEAPAPEALTRAILERNAAAAVARGRRGRWQLSAPTIALGLAGAAAAACAAFLVVLAPGSSSPPAPTVRGVATVALSPPTAAAPRLLVATGTRIAFPDWSARGWPRDGMRAERLRGRSVTAERYRSRGAGVVGYAIVSGPPLRWGSGGQAQWTGGQRYDVEGWGGAEIVAWAQDGHTCVLASRTAPAATMLALASAARRGTPA